MYLLLPEEMKIIPMHAGIKTISLILCVLFILTAGCTQDPIANEDPDKNVNDTQIHNMSAEAIGIALNDSVVRDYLRNGYEIRNVGPLCYKRSLIDRKIYKFCITGVEFETKNVYLIAYVDLEKHVVNDTATMYIRSPVIAHSEVTSPVPRGSDTEKNGT